jgi:hypothetical protein
MIKLRAERRTVDHAMGRIIERVRSGEPPHEEDLVEVRGSSELFAEIAEKFAKGMEDPDGE